MPGCDECDNISDLRPAGWADGVDRYYHRSYCRRADTGCRISTPGRPSSCDGRIWVLSRAAIYGGGFWVFGCGHIHALAARIGGRSPGDFTLPLECGTLVRSPAPASLYWVSRSIAFNRCDCDCHRCPAGYGGLVYPGRDVGIRHIPVDRCCHCGGIATVAADSPTSDTFGFLEFAPTRRAHNGRASVAWARPDGLGRRCVAGAQLRAPDSTSFAGRSTGVLFYRYSADTDESVRRIAVQTSGSWRSAARTHAAGPDYPNERDPCRGNYAATRLCLDSARGPRAHLGAQTTVRGQPNYRRRMVAGRLFGRTAGLLRCAGGQGIRIGDRRYVDGERPW